jgi:SAM-dependent methyltransferase
MPRYLTSPQASRFYDRFGSKQDRQGFYEDAPLADLAAHLRFEQARHVFEYGCGTGRYAARLLADHIAETATYAACDLSQTMIELARGNLAPFTRRVTLWQSGEVPDFLPGNPPFDIILSSYVLDLLSPEAISEMLAESARSLRPGGQLGLVSLTHGNSFASRITSRIWALLAELRPSLVGGCRPLELEYFLDPKIWRVSYRKTVLRWTIPSEVLIATRL